MFSCDKVSERSRMFDNGAKRHNGDQINIV